MDSLLVKVTNSEKLRLILGGNQLVKLSSTEEVRRFLYLFVLTKGHPVCEK
jgi:hypothetical protein|nr:MAG TPA: hypothetical protein [Caudoviricetes sp.]